jgi:hypothetical protein
MDWSARNILNPRERKHLSKPFSQREPDTLEMAPDRSPSIKNQFMIPRVWKNMQSLALALTNRLSLNHRHVTCGVNRLTTA